MPGYTREQIEWRLATIERAIDAAEDVGRKAAANLYADRQELEALLAQFKQNPSLAYAGGAR